jgi:hypothetical protein
MRARVCQLRGCNTLRSQGLQAARDKPPCAVPLRPHLWPPKAAAPAWGDQKADPGERDQHVQIEPLPFRARGASLDENESQNRSHRNKKPTSSRIKLPLRSRRKSPGTSRIAAITPPARAAAPRRHRKDSAAGRCTGTPLRLQEMEAARTTPCRRNPSDREFARIGNSQHAAAESAHSA